MFITFEGGEGSGKSTQVKKLAEHLTSEGHDVVVTREPGGTPEAEKIRDLLVRKDGGNWNGQEECLLFMAARVSHIRHVIAPALEAQKIVICDRFIDSTLVYQGYGHGLDIGFIQELHKLTIGSFEPTLTFLLDIDVEEGLARSGKRLTDEDSAEDKFESLGLVFHQKLREGFLSLASEHKNRMIVLDALKSVDLLHAEIVTKLNERLKA